MLTADVAMMPLEAPSQDILRSILDYDAHTGLLFWRPRSAGWFSDAKFGTPEGRSALWNRRYTGTEALAAIDGNGYKSGTLLNLPVKAHRVIWVLETGQWPAAQIDHIDHDRLNNRFGNLRLVDTAQNSRNAKLRHDNKSGATGVYWRAPISKWGVHIRFDGRLRHLGFFESFDDAVATRARAAADLGFHPNHGVL